MIDSDLAGAIRCTLDADRVWGVYALADLQPALARYSSWQLQHSPAGATGLALLYTGLQPPILFTAGDPALVAAGLAAWAAVEALPPSAYLSIREEHEAVIRQWYDNSRDRRQMWRMALPNAHVLTEGADQPQRTIRLHPTDAQRIAELYAHGGPFTPDAFEPHQLDEGVFYGIEQAQREGDRRPALVAVGGTHVVDWKEGIAAIGNMYTHPEQRGRGYAGTILAAIVADLRRHAVQTIILNVDRRNTGARCLYERHGFSVHCPYLEGIAHRYR